MSVEEEQKALCAPPPRPALLAGGHPSPATVARSAAWTCDAQRTLIRSSREGPGALFCRWKFVQDHMWVPGVVVIDNIPPLRSEHLPRYSANRKNPVIASGTP